MGARFWGMCCLVAGPVLLLVNITAGPGHWLELLPPAAGGFCGWLVERLEWRRSTRCRTLTIGRTAAAAPAAWWGRWC